MANLGDGLILPAATAVWRFRSRGAWLKARRRFLGASNAAKVIGVSGYGGKWSARDSVLGAGSPTSTVQAWGLINESRTLEDFARFTGARVVHLSHTVVIGPEPWQGCTPDAFVQVDGAWGLAEAKDDTTAFPWGPSGAVVEAWTAEAATYIREDYATQAYVQMAWSGLPFCVLVVRRSLRDLRWYTLLRDPEIEETIMPQLADFWERCIVKGELPEVDDSLSCARALARLFPKEAERVYLEAENGDLELVAERHRLKQAKEDTTNALRELDNRLGVRIGEATGIQLPPEAGLGRRVTWVRPEGRAPHIRIT